eukprot:scaffold2277_cov108-Isochrysis_galbana.AAC.3
MVRLLARAVDRAHATQSVLRVAVAAHRQQPRVEHGRAGVPGVEQEERLIVAQPERHHQARVGVAEKQQRESRGLPHRFRHQGAS